METVFTSLPQLCFSVWKIRFMCAETVWVWAADILTDSVETPE